MASVTIDQHKPVPIHGAYWVEPGRFLAGPYPGGFAPGEAEDQVGALLDAGIRTLLDLTHPLETDRLGCLFEPYLSVAVRLARERHIEVTRHHIPIVDQSVPSHRNMVRIQQLLDDSIRQHRPVYLHCWGGLGRTGTAVGVWLLRHRRATAENFIEVIRDLRKHAGWPEDSPSDPSQVALVRGWRH